MKCWQLTVAGRLKSFLRCSRAFRHWRGAAWLAEHGFRTAACYSLLRGRVTWRGPGIDKEILIMEALPGKSVLHHLADRDLGVGQEHALARALGRMLADLARAGAYNRDGKPSNLIVTRTDPPEIAVIDCVAIRAARGASMPLERSAARLLIEPRGVGCPVRRGAR